MKPKSLLLKCLPLLAIAVIAGFIIRIQIGVGLVSHAKCYYLNSHCISFKPETWASDSIARYSFNRLHGDGKEYDVFIYGEEHGYNYSHLFDLQYFKYLNETYGISVYLDEISASSASMLDKFINSSQCDTLILKTVLNDIRQNIPQRYTWDYYNKWVSLREYNIRKDTTQRIHVKGLLPDDYFEGKYSSRDDAMFTSFELISAESVGPYYCSIGQFHAMRDTILAGAEFLPFAGRLEIEGMRVHSTVMLPASSYSYYPDGSINMDSENGPFCYTYGIKNLMRCSKRGEMAYFAIDKLGTPYCNDSKDLLTYSSLFDMYGHLNPLCGHSTIDYFQSVLLIYGFHAPHEFSN